MAPRLPSIVELFLFRMRTFYREPEVIFWVYVFPLLAMTAFGLAFRPASSESFAVGVLDGGDGGRTQALETALASAKELKVRRLASRTEADRALVRNDVTLVAVASEPPAYLFDPTRT